MRPRTPRLSAGPGCRCCGPGSPNRPRSLAALGAAVRQRGAGGLGGGVRPGRVRWVDLPTYAFQRQRYWPAWPTIAGGRPWPAGTGPRRGSGRRWTRRMCRRWPGRLQVPGDAPLSAVLPVLSRWRRQQREQAVLDGWRYRVTWQPVPDPQPAVLAGRWLLVVPAGLAGTGLAGRCARVLADGGAEVVTVEVDLESGGLDRTVLAAVLGQALGRPPDGESRGWCRCWRWTARAGVAGSPGPAAGWPGRWCWCRRWGMPGIGARLWVLTSGAVAAAAGECA